MSLDSIWLFTSANLPKFLTSPKLLRATYGKLSQAISGTLRILLHEDVHAGTSEDVI